MLVVVIVVVLCRVMCRCGNRCVRLLSSVTCGSCHMSHTYQAVLNLTWSVCARENECEGARVGVSVSLLLSLLLSVLLLLLVLLL